MTRRQRSGTRPIPFLVWPVFGVVLVLAAALLIVLSPVLVPVAAFHIAKSIAFKQRWAGYCFLVASRRRGWFDFVNNNVAPVLPTNIIIVWDRHQRNFKARPKVVRMLRVRPSYLPRPYLVVVTRWRLGVVPLHERLQPLKSSIEKNLGTQSAVSQVIDECVSGA